MKVDWVPFGEVVRVVDQTVSVDPEATYRMLGVRSWGRGAFEAEDLPGHATRYPKLRKCLRDQFVYPKLMAWEGAFARVGQDLNGRFVSPEFIIFEVVDDSQLDPMYLEHFLHSSVFLHEVRSLSPGTNVRRRRLNVSELLTLGVPLPDRDEQQGIAQHLDGMASHTDRIAGLAELKVSPKSIGRISVGHLLSEVSRPVQVAADRRYEMQGVRWYGEGMFTREIRAGAEVRTKHLNRIENGDLVYNRLFAWKESFALAEREGFGSNEFPTFAIDKTRVLPRVLLELLLSSDFTAQVNAASTGSTPTSRNRLKVNDFLRLEVDLPSLGVQVFYEEFLRTRDRARPLARRVDELSAALLPAARNEIFNSMQ